MTFISSSTMPFAIPEEIPTATTVIELINTDDMDMAHKKRNTKTILHLFHGVIVGEGYQNGFSPFQRIQDIVKDGHFRRSEVVPMIEFVAHHHLSQALKADATRVTYTAPENFFVRDGVSVCRVPLIKQMNEDITNVMSAISWDEARYHMHEMVRHLEGESLSDVEMALGLEQMANHYHADVLALTQ